MDEMIAVSWSDYEKYGCVHCGCEYVHGAGFSGGGCTPVKCGKCEGYFIILANGLSISPVGFGKKDGTGYDYPVRTEHPRTGTPKHEYVRPDIRPPEGEYWMPRGVGYDLSGFVKCKAAGERIVKLIECVIGETPKSWLDYRPKEPNWIQVKIKEEDGFDLEKLCRSCEDGTITYGRLMQARVASSDA